MRLIFFLFLLLTIPLCAPAQSLLHENFAILNNSSSTVEQKLAAYTKVFNHYQYAQPDSAQWYAKRGLDEFTESGNELGIASMTVLLALVDGSHGRFEAAKKKQLSALEIFTRLNDKHGMANAHNGLGVIDGKLGDFEDAIKHFTQALTLFEAIQDTNGVASTYFRIGVVSEKTNALDQALEYYAKVLKLLETGKVQTTTDIVYVYNNMGIVYAKKGDIGKALPYFEKALAGSNAPEKVGLRMMTLNNLGIVYDNLGNDKMSLHYIDEALKLTQDKNMPEEHTRLIISRAAVVGKQDPAAALKTLNGTLDTIRALGMRSIEADIYDVMVDMYSQTGDYKNAFVTLSRLRRLEDSLESTDKAKEIANLLAVQELEASTARLALAEAKSNTARLTRNATLGIAGLLAAALVGAFWSLRRTSKLNAALSLREADLQRSNEMKDKLFSIIGHDLRGPIGNIPVMLDLMNDPDITNEERQYITDSIIIHTQASNETLDKLLYWGQAQIKGTGLHKTTFTAAEHINNCLQLTNTSANHKQISVTSGVTNDIRVSADISHFEFIMRNLLSNAIKFTHPGGSITIGADSRQIPGMIVFSVADTGVGISPDRINEIFKPFASSTRGTADEKGTSIGLMLCQQFVRENGGEIWVRSILEKGTTFYFTIPAAGTA